jgi:hypothetical protein
LTSDDSYWEGFFRDHGKLSQKEVEEAFRARYFSALEIFKGIDLRIEEIRNSLKKTFFNSIMLSRSMVRDYSFLQLKMQKKTSSKIAIVEKLMGGLREDLQIFTVLQEFKSTFGKAKSEIERRANFDFLMIGFLKLLSQLMCDENQQRKKYLVQNSHLLPQTFCPFLTNFLSEQILKQLEVYFASDTTVDELEKEQVQKLKQSRALLGGGDMILSLKLLLEEYMRCAETLNPIHQDLSCLFHPDDQAKEQKLDSSVDMKEVLQGSQFRIQIKKGDFERASEAVLNRSSYEELGEEFYIDFDCSVKEALNDQPETVLTLGQFNCSKELLSNPSFTVVN